LGGGHGTSSFVVEGVLGAPGVLGVSGGGGGPPVSIPSAIGASP
tara:strand:- start:320 stop:451 length:132 start_codon:yes stop_codon:yes gene_type:complete